MYSENQFGNNLYKLRVQHGLTQTELAKKLHVSVKSVKNWENGLSCPNIVNLSAVMKAFHLSADALLGSSTKSDYVMIPNDIPAKDQRILRGIINAIIQAYCDNMLGAGESNHSKVAKKQPISVE